MTALWIILSIVAWFLVGIAFARLFRFGLARGVESTVGMGWWFILFWPLWALVLLVDVFMDSLSPFGMFGDHLAAVAKGLKDDPDPTSHDRMLEAVSAARTQIRQHLAEAVPGPEEEFPDDRQP